MLEPRFAMRVKNRAFENGLMTLGLSGIIDGNEGESTTLAPVSRLPGRSRPTCELMCHSGVCGDSGTDQ